MNFGVIQFELDGIDIILPKLSILYMDGEGDCDVQGSWLVCSVCGGVWATVGVVRS